MNGRPEPTTNEVLDALRTLNPDALKLLARAYWRYEDFEYGAPAIECKRPYGNSSVEECPSSNALRR